MSDNFFSYDYLIMNNWYQQKCWWEFNEYIGKG